MNTYQAILLVIFSVVFYMMIVDKNVAEYFLLIFKIMKMNMERIKWLIILHPKNPITTWNMNRRANRIARELQKEFASKQ